MFAVIGSGYGDEGKGLTTDYLAKQNPGHIVVRSNGGAQAGHTVVTPEGNRHVFSHFGSGTFAGATTHLSKHMIVNPMIFRREHGQLMGKPLISVSPDCLVTIPQDMILNQMKEAARGGSRHGSCGMGINETVVRSNLASILVKDLADLYWYDLDDLRRLIPRDNLPSPYDKLLYDDQILVRYLDDVAYFLENVQIVDDSKVDVNLIFEGAQGLGLDQASRDFPHVTRSNTGMKNINDYTSHAPIDTYFVTRCYVSRHGAGPLLHEGQLTGVTVDDPTNQPNDWQGTLRFAPLDLDVLKSRIWAEVSLNVTPHLVVTCLDQVDGLVNFYMNGHEYDADAFDMSKIIADYLHIPMNRVLESWGNNRDFIMRPKML